MSDGNVPDQVTVEQNRSWLQRIAQSVLGVLFGIVLVIGASVLLFWNEGRAVTTARSLTEGAGIVRTVAADRIDPANDGKLVHVTGTLSASGPAADAEFAMKGEGVRLVRSVEMLQWTEQSEQETSKRLGGGDTTRTTYKYKREWADHPVDSSRFHEREGHHNPQMTWHGRDQVAPDIKLGAFAVPQSLTGHFGSPQPLAAGDDQVQAAQGHTRKSVQAIDGALFIGNDPDQPVVGDYRIRYSVVPLQAASVIAQQAGAAFQPYLTEAGGTVSLIEPGQVSVKQMFKEAQDENRMMTWGIRLGGAILTFVGFCLVLGPIGVLADVIPLLGDVVRVGTGLAALLMTAVLSPIVIAIAWFFYRPLTAVIILAVGAVIAYGAIHWARTRKAAAKPMAAA